MGLRLIRFAKRVGVERVGEPAVLAVVAAGGYGHVREDGVRIVPIGTLGP